MNIRYPIYEGVYRILTIQRGKAARVPDFDVPAVTAAIPGFNDFPAS